MASRRAVLPARWKNPPHEIAFFVFALNVFLSISVYQQLKIFAPWHLCGRIGIMLLTYNRAKLVGRAVLCLPRTEKIKLCCVCPPALTE
jgi:hypothetical protein